MVIEDIKKWWSNTGIPTKHDESIVIMIQDILDSYRGLKKHKDRGGIAKDNRDNFVRDLQNTFWIVTNETEEKLKNSTNSEKHNDWLYLEKIRGTKRAATLGSVDSQNRKKVARKITREEQNERKTLSKINISPLEEDIMLSSSSEDEIDLHDPDIKYNLKSKTPRRSKRTKKKQVVTPEVCGVALKYRSSNRQVCEYVGASTPEIDPKEKSLSVNTVRRRKLKYTEEAAKKIFDSELSKSFTHYSLHWDSKVFKATEHCKKSVERIAVVLTTSDGTEILLGIMPVENGTASEEHKIIFSLLNEKQIPLDKIAACVFDTTSVNTGELRGIVRRMEASCNHSFLELACRHHIYELVCGASSEIVLGKAQQDKGKGKGKKTTSPYEPLFKSLCNHWEETNQEDISIFEEKSIPRSLIRHIFEAKEFLYKWLDNHKTMREDYKELAKLCLIYLGGNLPKKMSEFKFRAPGAYHHARWMSKILYVLQIAMIKPHYINDIGRIRSLALFYSVYYAKAWLTSIFPSEAPIHDLAFLKALEEVSHAKGLWPEGFQEIAVAALEKLKAHTWYLSERLVGLALFSDVLDISTKETMRIAIKKYNKKPVHIEQQRPECSSFLRKQLKDFVGPDTHIFFDLLNLKKEILSIPASKWHSSSIYHHNKKIIKLLPVVNDAAERALGMASSMHGQTMPKNEKQLQESFKVVHAIRKAQRSIAKSSERVTKQNLHEFLKLDIFNLL